MLLCKKEKKLYNTDAQLRQRSRPYLFSNSIPPPVAAAASKVSLSSPYLSVCVERFGNVGIVCVERFDNKELSMSV